MSNGVRRARPRWQRRGRPEAAGVFVTDEHGFARRVADGVVAPGREPVLMAVDRPGVAGPALGRSKTKGGMRDDVGPWRRRQRALVVIDVDHVLASVLREATGAIEHLEAGSRTGGLPARLLRRRHGCGEPGNEPGVWSERYRRAL